MPPLRRVVARLSAIPTRRLLFGAAHAAPPHAPPPLPLQSARSPPLSTSALLTSCATLATLATTTALFAPTVQAEHSASASPSPPPSPPSPPPPSPPSPPPSSYAPPLSASMPLLPPVAPFSRHTVADAVEKVMPSVVNIRRVITRPQFRVFFSADAQPVEVSCGSGFFISSDGLLLTNTHVVRTTDADDDADSVLHVTLSSGETFVGRVVAADARTDIALVKINADRPLPVATLGDSDAVRAGEFVIAVGSPLMLANSCSFGIVSTIHRDLANGSAAASGGLTYLQLDVAMNQGSSGGPCVTLDGAVIGICSMKIAGGAEGIGFAIPIAYARSVVDELQTHGFVRRPYVGLTVISVTPSLLEDIRQDTSYRPPRWLEAEMRRTNSAKSVGLMIHDVAKGGPGDRAGLRAGDVVVSVNHVKTTTTSEFLAALSFQVHKDCRLSVRRAATGKTEHVTVCPEVLQTVNAS